MVLDVCRYYVDLYNFYSPFTNMAPKVANPPHIKLKINASPTILLLDKSVWYVGMKIKTRYTNQTNKEIIKMVAPILFINPIY